MPPPPAPHAAAQISGASRTERLQQRPRRAGEASFFFYSAHFRRDAVKVLPGEYSVDDQDRPIMTTIGSCIAACLWDRHARIGGMNRFMLPAGNAECGRYGSYAMELLINELLKRGAARATLDAKVFGGGQVISGMAAMNVGERNTAFVLDYLKTERIPVLSHDVLGIYPRKVCFLPASGRAMVKRLTTAHPEEVIAQDRAAARSAARQASRGGAIDLF